MGPTDEEEEEKNTTSKYKQFFWLPNGISYWKCRSGTDNPNMPAMEVQLAQESSLTKNPVNYIWNVGAPPTDKWTQLLPLPMDNVIATVTIIHITSQICQRLFIYTLAKLCNS